MKSSKRILILGAGPEQCIAIQEAKSLGYEVFVADGDENAIGLKNEKSHVIDISDKYEVLKLAKSLNLNGIFCHGVEIPEIVAFVGNSLGLPSLPESIAQRCTDKIERISFLKKNNIPCPNYKIIKDEEDFKNNEIEYPCILKPIDSSGARGVTEINKPSEFKKAFKTAMSFTKNKKILLEEKLSGQELSTESIIYKNQIITFAVADRNYESSDIFSPYFIEDGINYPSKIDQKLFKKVIHLVEKTIRTLGINYGSAKGDIIIHEGKPFILEMACRTSGGWFCAGSIPAATGINALNPLIKIAVGDTPDLSFLEKKYSKGCAQRYLIPKKNGILEEIKGIDKAIKSKGIHSYDLFLPNKGDKIEKCTNHSQRFAQFIFTGATREEAMLNAERAMNKIDLKIN